MVRCQTSTQSPYAVSFYRRHGFEVVGRTDGDNEEGAPDLRMEWRPVSAGGSPR